MKIELIKYKFDDTQSFKYKPYQFCCEKIKQAHGIVFTNQNIVGATQEPDDENYNFPQFCINVAEEWDEDWGMLINNYPIQYCPYCGEKININLVEELDVDDEFQQLSETCRNIKSLIRKAKNKEEQYKITDLYFKTEEQLNSYYLLSEYDTKK